MKNKNLITIALALTMVLALSACGGTSTAVETTVEESTMTEVTSAAPESVTIKTLNGAKGVIDLEVPYDPQRIAVMDLAALDMLDNLGLGERIVGVSKGSSIDYLQSYMDNQSLANLGTIKEANLEAVMSSEPDVIFIGGRLSSQYDSLSQIAPVVFLTVDAELGLVPSVQNNALTIASMFGLESLAEQKMDGFGARIQALAAFAEGKTTIMGMCTSGSFNTLGNDGRCAIIGTSIGFENLAAGDITSTHGNESSFELLVSLNPDYIFILDRDSAIGTDGAQLAKDIMENELVMKTTAYQNGNLVYLEHPAVWYTAEGGITALDYMLSDLETALLN